MSIRFSEKIYISVEELRVSSMISMHKLQIERDNENNLKIDFQLKGCILPCGRVLRVMNGFDVEA